MSTEQNATDLLVHHLRQQEHRGTKTVWLTEDAKERLGNFSPPERVSAPVKVPIEVASPPAAATTPISDPAPGALPLEERHAALRAIKADVASCPRCKAAEGLRDTMVFAVGNAAADLMVVGEAPGNDEEAQQEPFVGKAGQLLTKIIQTMGLGRGDIYISNICKYRPRLPNQTTQNRKPTMEEMDLCLPFIRREVEVVQPKVIVALGATAAEGLLDMAVPVARMRSKFHDYQGIPTMVTYHPSYLLRNEALSERRKVWEDMLMVMEELGMPVSEKQRGFFKG